MMKRWLMLLFLGCALPAWAGTVTLTPLAATAVPALVKPPAQGARIIALWALDCAYCEPNLEALAKLQRRHRQSVELVLVATDGPASKPAVAARLVKMRMTAYPAYLYDEPAPERINYLIDPTWGGETPRTLVIHADGSRTAVSGELTAAQLQRIEQSLRPR